MTGMRNCHARGVHSIILDKAEDGRLTRAFIAEADHTLWRNMGGTMSVGYHPHHCDIEIEVVSGWIFNLSLLPEWTDGAFWVDLRAWRYRSALRGEAPGFELASPWASHVAGLERVSRGGKLVLPAKVAHTIYVPARNSATWIVREGKEDPSYQPLTYSNDDLWLFDWTGMYEPMTERECEQMLRHRNLSVVLP